VFGIRYGGGKKVVMVGSVVGRHASEKEKNCQVISLTSGVLIATE